MGSHGVKAALFGVVGTENAVVFDRGANGQICLRASRPVKAGLRWRYSGVESHLITPISTNLGQRESFYDISVFTSQMAE